MKIKNTLIGLYQMFKGVKVFDPDKIFKNKRIAIIGAAESAFQEQNGKLIESYDIVVRLNKALITWRPEHEKFVGKRADVLFHSFYENEYSGGGPVTLNKVNDFNVQYIVNPHNNIKGWRAHLNFYKRGVRKFPTYLLRKKSYNNIEKSMENWTPTVGFCALHSVLRSSCREIFITGFTFFKTPYSNGYRDHFNSMDKNIHHIEQQGIHNPDFELKLLKLLIKDSNCPKILLDQQLIGLLQKKN